MSPPSSTSTQTSAWPSWVVLRRHVPVFADGDKQQEDATMGRATKELVDSAGLWILRGVTLDAHLVEPPELSTLSLRANVEVLERGIQCCVESAVKNMVVIKVQSASTELAFMLIYDAAKNSLSLAPTAETFFFDPSVNRHDPPRFLFLSRSAVIPREDGSYDLADMRFPLDHFEDQVLPPSGVLFRWSSSSRPVRWTGQEARFNLQIPLPMPHPKRLFYEVDEVFTFNGKAFWVDLLLGAIVCDMPSTSDDGVALDFIHLPTECQGSDFPENFPRDCRTMGIAGDSVKFISVVTVQGSNPDDDTPPSEVVIKSWTLMLDLREWRRDDDMELPLPLLWESEAYKYKRLPESVPMMPVLRVDEDGILYFLLADYFVDRTRKLRLCRGEMEYVIRVDMGSKTLLSCSHRPITDGLPVPVCAPWREPPPQGFFPDMPELLGAKFCAYHSEPG